MIILCKECRKYMSSDVYVCPHCGKHHSDEEIQALLDEQTKGRGILKKAAKILFLVFIALLLLAQIYSVIDAPRRNKFIELSNNYLDTYDWIDDYKVDKDGCIITMNNQTWYMTNSKTRQNLIDKIQQDLTAFEINVGYKPNVYVHMTIQDNNKNVLYDSW